MTTSNPTSAADIDYEKYLSARDSDHTALLTHAAKSSGRSPVQIQREFNRIAKSHSKLNMAEYVRNGLHHSDRFSDAQRSEYISNDLHWPITHICNHTGWQSAAEDKVIATTLLNAVDVPVPDIVGVIDQTSRVFPGIKKICTADELREVVLDNLHTGLFGKITEGMVSFGAFRIQNADNDTLTCAGMNPVPYEEFLSETVGQNSYVLQPLLHNHPALSPYASALATIRMVNLLRTDDVFCPIAVIKLPQNDNIADAFWRPGNLACAIDPETGKITTVTRRDGMEVTFLEDHPETAGLMGMQLPYWQELREINSRAARTFAPIRYQSTDIAITESGPVVVELNYGGGFDLPQYATGRGMLTKEVRDFFESFGYDFGQSPNKKRLSLLGFRR